MARYRIGIDIGGTFTDLCVLDEEGSEVYNSKVLSTPADLTRGVIQALDDFFAGGRA
ncbi:MAG: ROK family protein, partial [Deltaproteobacteria bacterium]